MPATQINIKGKGNASSFSTPVEKASRYIDRDGGKLYGYATTADEKAHKDWLAAEVKKRTDIINADRKRAEAANTPKPAATE